MIRLRGDAAPLDYEVGDGQGVARVRLREGQARRLREGDLPPLDRPLRFAVVRGRHQPVLADTVAELHAELRRAPKRPGATTTIEPSAATWQGSERAGRPAPRRPWPVPDGRR